MYFYPTSSRAGGVGLIIIVFRQESFIIATIVICTRTLDYWIVFLFDHCSYWYQNQSSDQLEGSRNGKRELIGVGIGEDATQ